MQTTRDLQADGTTGLPLSISEYTSKLDNRPRRRELIWGDLVLRLLHHDERPDEDGPGWSPATYPEEQHRSTYPALDSSGRPHPKAGQRHPFPWRNNLNIGEITVAVADLEKGADLRAILAGLNRYDYVLHTMFSHTLEDPHHRLVLPLAAPVPSERWPGTWMALNTALSGGANDPQTKDPSRFYYWPSCKPGAECLAEHHPGVLLDPDAIPAAAVSRPEDGRAPAVVGGIPAGQRNGTLASLAGTMRRRGMGQAAIAAALLVENAERCDPPLDEAEVEKIAASIARYDPAEDAIDLSEASSSPSPSLRSGDGDDDAEGRRAPQLVTLARLRELYSGEVVWHAEGYVALCELTVVPGPPESFKSWAVADLARATLTGGLWLGHFPVPQGTVLYVEQERANNLVHRMGLLERAHGCDLAELLVLPPGNFRLTDPANRALLRALVG